MTTQQNAIKQARSISEQIDELQIRKSTAEREHAKQVKQINDEMSILRSKLSTLLAIADQ